MTLWLERQEQIHHHTGYVHWQEEKEPAAITRHLIPNLTPQQCIKMSKRPSAYGISIKELESDYGASSFREAFARFVVQWQIPGIRQAQLSREAQGVHLPFISVSTYHRIKFRPADEHSAGPSVDVVVAQPARHVTCRSGLPKATHGRHDTVLVHCGRDGDTGVRGESIPNPIVICPDKMDGQCIE